MSTPAVRGGGSRKSLDAAINLVPFIDLLSCCISFLLITAVWVNLSQMPVRHGTGGQGEAPLSDVQLTLVLTADGFVLARSTGERTQINNADGGDAGFLRLAQLLQSTKRELPTQDAVTLRSSDGVRYDRLIKTIDVLRAASFPNVHVSEHRQDG